MINELPPLKNLGIQLIGIHGHAGSGKDTIADYLYATYADTYSEHFADPLKRACSEAFGINEEDFYDSDKKEHPTMWGVSPRQIAQFVGTDMFRLCAPQLLSYRPGPTFWIQRMEFLLRGMTSDRSAPKYEAGETVVIPDVRFQDELDWVLDSGGVIIHLVRPGADGNVGIPGHASEATLFIPIRASVIHIHNNSTKEVLYETVDQTIEHFNSQMNWKITRRDPLDLSQF